MPKISVIVPNYNHARFLRRRLDTIMAQTFQDFELILLDDCSTDESRSILREYSYDPRVRLEFNEANSGTTFKQWNKGIQLAQGEYVWIAESDDYADAHLLKRLLGLVENDPVVAFAYCRSWRTTEDDRLDGFVDFYPDARDPRRWAEDFCLDGPEMCRKYFVRANPVPNASAVLFRRAIYERVSGPDCSLRLCADWKLWAAMALAGKVAYIAEPLNYFRFHDASIRSQSNVTAANLTESFHVIRWVSQRITLADGALEEIRDEYAWLWVPALVSRIPRPTKRMLLQQVRAFDPQLVRRSLRPALTIVWCLACKHFVHPILNWTRSVRHLMGLNRANVSAALKRNRRRTS